MNISPTTPSLDRNRFDNRFVAELPGDPEARNFRRQVSKACYSRVMPTKVASPGLVHYSQEVLELLGLEWDPNEEQDFADVFAGNRLLPGMDPFATNYGGHQFGTWAGQLGDGRAINLGELINPQGERWTLQLKGAGPTPYSRTADGLAVLRSSVREFLCSEAMYHLGVPTTRALSLVLTGEDVLRDMFYDGNPKHEPGAVVCRVAPTFTRFGNFQIFTARQDFETLRQLADYTIRTDFPHLGEPSPDVYVAWFEEICRTTAEMIVHWMRVGFVHGVMNTDNMSILGLTIDYGPYGWLEDFDPGWTPNTTDAQTKRYRFGNQPNIAFWNLLQFANAIAPLIEKTEPLEQALKVYSQTFETEWHEMRARKLGLEQYEPKTDDPLITELLSVLQLTETDMTIFVRKLADLRKETDEDDERLLAPIREAYYLPDEVAGETKSKIVHWLRSYQNRLQQDSSSDDERREQMNSVNPKYVLRNYLAQLAIDQAETGDFELVRELLDLLRRPYDEQPDREQHARKRPDWARERAGCSMLSCSS
ncbi:MAG TPA: YdiU family protein [Planctomycetaceae bacterium]|nr:YdiU family protein [Planctomycetaceae bacterium]